MMDKVDRLDRLNTGYWILDTGYWISINNIKLGIRDWGLGNELSYSLEWRDKYHS